MREPYETLLGHYRDEHWFLGQYLDGEEPDWGGIASDHRLNSLSTGEKVLVDFACAFYNAFRHLDVENQYRVTLALAKVCGMNQ